MLLERPYTRLTRARLGLAIGSQTEQTSISSSQQQQPRPTSSSASAYYASSAASNSSSAPDTQPQISTVAPYSHQHIQHKQQRQQRKQPKQPKQQPKQQAQDKKVYTSSFSTKITFSSSSVDTASDDTADTANIAPKTPEYSSSSEPSRPVGQERTRGRSGATGMLEVDTQSRYYPPSPYRTPTWSPESTSNQQADVALQQELLERNQQEEGRSTNPTSTEDPLLSPLSLLSAVASVVGNHIGSPGLSNLDDLATYESLRSLSAAAPVVNPPLNSSMARVQDSAMTYAHREQGHAPSLTPMSLQDPASLPPITTTLPTRLPIATGLAPQITSPATTPRKRGRPPKNSNAAPNSSADSGRWTKLSAIAPRPLQEDGFYMAPRQRSDTPCSTSSSSSFRHLTIENRLIMPMGNTAATIVQTINGHGQSAMHNKVRATPRLKHNRKPNPDGAIWSVAELAAETSSERRPARAIVYADENIKKLVEGNRVCIMEPCFRTPVRNDLYCLGLPDDETGHRHENGGICIDEKWGCQIVLAFRYRYQLKLDVTYLAWVSTIDMATIPVSVLRDFSANREVMRQALGGEERMSEQYRLLSDAGYFTPRKVDKRSQDNNPGVTLDGWSIAHQNEVLMASMSNRLGFLQWVAQAYQMARDSSACPVDTKKEPSDNTIKELHLATSKRMKFDI